MQINYAADFQGLFGRHTPEESKALEEMVVNHPEMLPPGILWGNAPKPNTMIEGHERDRLAKKHGVKLKYVVMNFECRDDALNFARKMQLARRNLTESQRALLVAELTKSRQKIGRPTGNSASVPDLIAMANEAGTSRRTMASAVKVSSNGAPAVKRAVKAGNVSVRDAAAVADLPKQKQAAALAKKRSGKAKTLKQAAADFDPKALEAQAAKEPKKLRSGKPVVPTKLRKETLEAFNKLVRGLNALDIYNEFIVPLSQIAKRLKQV